MSRNEHSTLPPHFLQLVRPFIPPSVIFPEPSWSWYRQCAWTVQIPNGCEHTYVCLCVYLCHVFTYMWTSMSVYLSMSAHTHTLTCMYLCVYTLECEHIYVCASVCMCTYACKHVCVCVSMCIPINVYEYIWMCLHTLCFSARQWMFALLLAKSCSRQIMCLWFSLKAKRIHQSS